MASTVSIASDIRRSLSRHENLKERISLLTRLVSYRQVDDSDGMREVQALRYRAYRKEGAVQDSATPLLSDRYDQSINGATYALFFAGHLCASIRLHFAYDWQRESPACEAFPEELNPLLMSGERIIDPNCFCVDPDLAGGVPEFAYLTLRLPYMAATLRRRTSVVATARAEHMAFYRRVLRCHPIAQPRAYPGRTKALGLMLVDFDAEGEAIRARNPFFAPHTGEVQAMRFDRVDGGLVPMHRQEEELLA